MCVVDEVGEVVSEQKVPTEPDDIVTLLTSIDEVYGRIGIEAGPLSQWLVNALAVDDRGRGAGLAALGLAHRQIERLVVSTPVEN